MTDCPEHLHGGTLACTRELGHAFGCSYQSSTGSDLDDAHTDGGHG